MAGTLINAATGIKLYLDEVDISCAINADDITLDRELVDARTFCGNAQVPGRLTGGDAFGGFGYFGAGEYEEQLNARLLTGVEVNRLTVYGNTAGSRYYEVRGPLGKAATSAKPDALIGLGGDIPKGSTITRGLALHVSQAFTTTGAQTGQNVGAVAATETFVAVIRVNSVDGAGSITFQINESSDNAVGDAYAQITGLTIQVAGLASAGTDAVTFTGAGIARLYKTAAVEAWRQLNITAYATFTSVTATVTTGTQAPAR